VHSLWGRIPLTHHSRCTKAWCCRQLCLHAHCECTEEITKRGQHNGRVYSAGLASSSTGQNSWAKGPKYRKLWKGLRPADRDFEAETGGVSTDSPAKMHLPAPGGPLGDSWSKMAKALPPAGRNLQGELASLVSCFSCLHMLYSTGHSLDNSSFQATYNSCRGSKTAAGLCDSAMPLRYHAPHRGQCLAHLLAAAGPWRLFNAT
jgi:hypothetical protein